MPHSGMASPVVILAARPPLSRLRRSPPGAPSGKQGSTLGGAARARSDSVGPAGPAWGPGVQLPQERRRPHWDHTRAARRAACGGLSAVAGPWAAHGHGCLPHPG